MRVFSSQSFRAIGLLFLLTAVVRVAMVLAFASPLPYFDEWDGIIAGMAVPLHRGHFDPLFLFASHNGHPLLWTKLISLLFLRAGDLQFDNIPVCILAQIIYAAGSTTLAWSVGSRLGPERGWFLLAAMLVILVPFDWENITMGWNDSHAILALFSVGSIIACVHADATVAGIAAICALAGAAAFSMASGLVAPVLGAAILLWRARLGEIAMGRAAGTGAVLMAWAALAFCVGRTTHPALPDAPWGVAQLIQMVILTACWLPAWIHLARYLKGERSSLDLAIICVALWGFAQIAAMILARPAFRLWFPISRYMDVIPIGMFAVLASLCRLGSSRRGLPFSLDAKLVRIALVATTGVVIGASPLAIHWQLRSAGYHRDQARVLRRYVESRDPRILADAPDSSLAYPSRERLQALLDDPDVDAVIAGALDRSRRY